MILSEEQLISLKEDYMEKGLPIATFAGDNDIPFSKDFVTQCRAQLSAKYGKEDMQDLAKLYRRKQRNARPGRVLLNVLNKQENLTLEDLDDMEAPMLEALKVLRSKRTELLNRG